MPFSMRGMYCHVYLEMSRKIFELTVLVYIEFICIFTGFVLLKYQYWQYDRLLGILTDIAKSNSVCQMYAFTIYTISKIADVTHKMPCLYNKKSSSKFIFYYHSLSGNMCVFKYSMTISFNRIGITFSYIKYLNII